jgi:hypothetical protein
MKKWLTLVAALAVAALAGCSAGGSSTPASTSTGGTTTATAPVLAIALSSTTVSSVTPATVAATVKSSTGSALSGVVVTFSVNASVGLLSSTTALTNTEGVASVTLAPASATVSGADTITASATVSALTGTASAGYQVNSTTAAVVSFKPNTGDASTDALAAYGQAVLTLTTTGVSPASPATFNVTSACTAIGKATISPSSYNATSNTTTFSYKDTGGCGSTLSSDTVTVSMSGASGTTSTQVYLTSPTANSITFSSATPPVIYLKGSGNVESSTVKFEVVDTAGNPLPGQVVTLNLSTFAGGLTLDQGTSAVAQTSDSNGSVTVIINSGTVPTPVRVTATLGNGASTVSSNLAVLTGLPTQTGFQLNPANINIEGFNHTISNTYTVYASDRSQNPVPDQTAILFWAESGLITGTATTTGGVATTTLQTSSHPNDGRVTVLAYAVGEESFVDLNGTNVYASNDPYQDLGNVVKNIEFDGQYNAATDEVISLSNLGVASGGVSCTTSFNLITYPSFAFNKSVPNQPGTCDGQWSGKTYVRRDVETVLSMDAANPLLDPAFLTSLATGTLATTCPASGALIQNDSATLASAIQVFPASNYSTLYVGTSTSGSFDFLASDANTARINPMAVGSTITAAGDGTGVQTAAVAVSGGTYTYPSTPSAQPVVVNYSFGSTTTTNNLGQTVTTVNSAGTVTLTLTSHPSGTVTTKTFNLLRSAPPNTCP